MTKSSADFFTKTKPQWVGDLGTRPKKKIFGLVWALYYPLLPEIFALVL
jgi:hypothetical protein